MTPATVSPLCRKTFLGWGPPSPAGWIMALMALLVIPLATSVSAAASDVGPIELFFPAERVARLKSRIAENPEVRTRWERLLARAEQQLQMPAVQALLADRTFASEEKYLLAARDLRQMALTLGLAWRVTGDERYAQPLRAALFQAVNYPEWAMGNTRDRTPPWHGDLWTAAFTIACTTGREALADFLTPTERARIGDAIVRLGIEPLLADWVRPETRIHALDSMGHNWWVVCLASAGVGTLGMLEHEPRARDWLREIDAALEAFFGFRGDVLYNKPPNFDPAGAFYEGVHYADYALSEFLTYRLARRQALPAEPLVRIPVLERAAEFFAHASYPASDGMRSVDFGDSRASDQASRAMRLLALHGHRPELSQWYLRQTDPASSDPLWLLFEPADPVIARNPLPESVLYDGIGWGMLRDAWAPNATLLAVRSGDTWNHAHADAGSFILWHAGKPLLIDSGLCSYARPEYTEYYRQSRAHNVVLFEGEGEPVEHFHDRGAKFPGRLHDLVDGLGIKYLYADATGPMARHFSRNYRHWLWLDGLILVVDDLLAHEPGRFDWLLHYAGEARRDGANLEIVNGPASARVMMLHPSDPEIREQRGLAPDEPDLVRNYLALSTRQPAREQKFIVAIVPRSDRPAPRVERFSAPGVLGVRVTTEAKTTDIYLNLAADGRRMHENSNLTVDGWETDAYLLALTRPAGPPRAAPDSVTRTFVVAGSYLRREGRIMLQSLSKVTAVFGPGVEPAIVVRGQPTLDVSFGNPAVPGELQVNGRRQPFEYDSARKLVRFQSSPPEP